MKKIIGVWLLLCFFPFSGRAAEGSLPVVFSEIAWMGTAVSANDEWIELFNSGDTPVDFSGWKIQDGDGGLSVSLSGVVAPGGYFLLERTDDESVAGIPADKVYTGALSNTGETLSLFDAGGALIESIDSWHGGDNTTKFTMQRAADGWCTAAPTPRAVNGCNVLSAPPADSTVEPEPPAPEPENPPAETPLEPSIPTEPTAEEVPIPENEVVGEEAGVSGDMDIPVTVPPTLPTDGTAEFPDATEPPPEPAPETPVAEEPEAEPLTDAPPASPEEPADTNTPPLTPQEETASAPPIVYPPYQLISEILPNPEGNDSEGEFVELKNPLPKTIDISGWYLDDAEGASPPFLIPANTSLSPFGILVFSEPGLGLSLKNSADEVRLLSPDRSVRQVVAYTDVEEDLSYALADDGLFYWTSMLTPGEPNRFPEPLASYEPGSLTIESALPNPAGTDSGEEKIRFFNATGFPIDLVGWSITDAQNGHRVFDSFVLEAGERADFPQEFFRLSLNNGADALTLFDPTDRLIDHFEWTEAASGEWLIRLDRLRDGMTATVTRVVDGDTLDAETDQGSFGVRLIGVDTPETVHPFLSPQPFGAEASSYLKNRLEGQSVTLYFDEDRVDTYNRVLAYVYLGEAFVNAELIEKGYARAYTDYPFRHSARFTELETAARTNRVGLWAALPEEEAIENETEVITESGESEMEEPATESASSLSPETETLTVATDSAPDCNADGLEIDAILPNPQKGESVEFIRLINRGETTLCLNGWSLDDTLDQGSKPFVIPGGTIAPGGSRTFRQEETKLTLNNIDDCASLVAPDSNLTDQLCYRKTRKNQVFTHGGGSVSADSDAPKTNRQPASSSVSKPVSKKAAKAGAVAEPAVARQAASLQWDLATDEFTGYVRSIEPETRVLYAERPDASIAPISYAGSFVDMAVAEQLLDFRLPVTVRFRATPVSNQLISLKPVVPPSVAAAPEAVAVTPRRFAEEPLGFLFFTVVNGLYIVRKLLP